MTNGDLSINIEELLPKIPRPKEPQKVDKEKIRKHKEFYVERLQHYGYKPNEPEIFDKLANYVAHAYNNVARRGLLLAGNTGNGKTTALRAIGKLLGLELITAVELAEFWKYDQKNDTTTFKESLKPRYTIENSERNPCPNDLIIDDLGLERLQINYGDKAEVGEMAIGLRYDLWQLKNARTLISTNLELTEIKERYGDRAYSRLHEMCTVIQFTGSDKRL